MQSHRSRQLRSWLTFNVRQMKKSWRFFVNAALPAPIACFILFAWFRALPSLRDTLVTVMLAYAYAGIPSLLHAVLMEWLYSRRVRPERGMAIAYSAASGVVAACLILLIAGLFRSFAGISALWFYLPLGAIVGALLALAILIPSRASHSA